MGVEKGDIVYVRIRADRYMQGLYHDVMRPLLEEYNRTDTNQTFNTTHDADERPFFARSNPPTPVADYRYFFYDVFMPVKIQGM